jgi:hypothetical protein
MRFLPAKPNPTPPSVPQNHTAEPSASPANIEDGIAQPSQSHPSIESRVLHKLDTHLLPLLSTLYLLAFLDRSNIGNAKIAGLQDDLNLSPSQYTWLLTIFYIAYILFTPCALLWNLIPPHIWAAFCVFGWGTVSAAQAGTTSWSGMMVCRFLMGGLEVAYGPGVTYFLSFFYLRHELGFRAGLFLSAAPLANMFAGALAYGITSGDGEELAKWRVLFLVEGLPTVGMSVVTWWFLPDGPEKARFLSEEEKEVARKRGVRRAGDKEGVRGIVWKEVLDGLKDGKGWILGVSSPLHHKDITNLLKLMYFSGNVAFSSLPVFLPTILNEMGFSSINAQGLTAPPFFLAFLVVIATTYIADRTQQRGATIAILTAIGGIGYVILAAANSTGAKYFGIFLAAGGIFPAIGNVLPWVTNNQGSDTRRGAGVVILNLVGQCGPLLGTRLYPSSEGPRFVKGHSVCAAFMFFFCFLSLLLRTVLAWENKRLDRKYGTVPQQKLAMQEAATKGEEKGDVAVENYGPLFRYVL